MAVFNLKRIALETLRYPSRKVKESELGLFSTFEKAYDMLQEYVAESKEDKEECEKEGEPDEYYAFTLGYSISQIQLDVRYGRTLAFQTYTRDGELNDESVWMDENGEAPPFYGRPEEKIRFKMGDIVEVIGFGHTAELSIVSSHPWTPQEVENWNKELEKKYGKGIIRMDSSDDCYLTHSLGLGNTHCHPACANVFAPTKKVPATLRRKLQAHLLEENFTFGYRLPISELPFAKEPKVLDELLKGWERFIAEKYYCGMESLVDYAKADDIKAQLDFSEEQAQRFDRFYEACVRLVNEKREKEKKDMSEARLVELKNPVYLKIEHKGSVYYHIGEKKDIKDSFDIDTPYEKDILQCIKDSCDFDSVERITPQQFKKEYRKALEAGEHVVLI